MCVCVVGIGNRWAGDDGVGLEAVRRLEAAWAPAGAGRDGEVAFLTLPHAGVELIEVMGRCDLLILVDAVSSGATPGTVHSEVWRPDRLAARGTERASSHGLGVREALGLAAALGKLPPRVILWGIEVASTAPGEGLSPAVAATLPIVVAGLCRELETQRPAGGAR